MGWAVIAVCGGGAALVWLVPGAGLNGHRIHILLTWRDVRQFGPATGEIVGAARTVIVYVISGVAGFFLSSTFGWFFAGVGEGISFDNHLAASFGEATQQQTATFVRVITLPMLVDEFDLLLANFDHCCCHVSGHLPGQV